jgi:GWxTD domain-containing protein
MAPLLLAAILGVTGTASERSTIRMDLATFQASDSQQRLELSFEIPYTAVVFTRDSLGYLGRFTLQVSCVDSRGEQLTADDWEHTLRLQDYDSTMHSQSVSTGRETLRVAMRSLTVDVGYRDWHSERALSWRFKVDPPKYLSDLRVEQEAGRAAFQSRDTLALYFETYGRNSELDSCRVRIVQGRRVFAGQSVAAAPDSWRQVHRLAFPLTELEDGEFEIQVEGYGPKLRTPIVRKTLFRVGNSFFRSDRAYRDKVNQLLYVATDAELKRLRLAAPAERESLWIAFWKEKDQTPTTEKNETEEEYFRRINYAIDHFGHGDRGYKSDRARVYVKLGPPDNVESLPFESHSNAYEVWYYYSLSYKLTFLDVNGFGEFKLIDPLNFFQTQGWQP